jgi:hypothetical protein
LTVAVDVEPSYHALAWKAFQMVQEGHSQREGKVVEKCRWRRLGTEP